MIRKLARGRRVGAALAVGGLLATLVGVAAPGPAQGVAAPATGLSAFVNGVLDRIANAAGRTAED